METAAQFQALAPDCPTRFAFGAVRFELNAGARLFLPPDLKACLSRDPAPEGICATVRCMVSSAPVSAENNLSREVKWSWDGAGYGRVHSAKASASLQRREDGSYQAAAVVEPTQEGTAALLSSISAAIVYHEGGLVLHASAVDLGDRTVLFVGPSGAGKSTACSFVKGARLFAVDRVAVTSSGWAWALPGGHRPLYSVASMRAALPVAGILRVRHGIHAVQVRSVPLASAVMALRESTFSAGGAKVDTISEMQAVEALAAQVLVGEIETVLGQAVNDVLGEWLRGEGASRG